MTSVREIAEDILQEENDEDLMDYLSDGEDEDEPIEELDRSFPESVFICNVPKVGKEKEGKLAGVLSKVIDKFGKNDKFMPMNESTNQTEGFLIVTFENKQDADKCARDLNGYALDKTHTFKVVKLDDFNVITSRKDAFQPRNTIARPCRKDHKDWLADQGTREQFLLRYGAETEIYWHDTIKGEPELYYGGEREKAGGKIWCDWKVQFSPQGSFISTFHKQGIALWAGREFTKWAVRFPHANVKYIEFSPNEEFLLTWNGSHPKEDDGNAVCFFRVLSGECMQKCRTPHLSPLNDKGDFPHFLWSPDSKFFAECNDSTILVRDTETFDLIRDEEGRKRNLKYENLATFQWSPKDNIIAVWTLEKDNNPARLVLVEIPSRKELAARSRTQVEAKMYWQSNGDYLCLLVTKLSKTKKKGATNLEIFHVREKAIPVEVVEVPDTVKAFHWETGGSRFAVITTDDTGHKPKLLFYALTTDKFENVRSLDLPSNIFTDVFWAPGGQYFVCAAIQASGGDLIFGGLMPDNKLEILHRDEHFMLTHVEWDPSSRYVITAVTQPMRDEGGGFKYQMEAGYAIWTFQGRQLCKFAKDKLFSATWRPHPPPMITEDQQKSIRKNIKKYSKKYDALDEQEKETARQEFKRDRDTRLHAFLDILNRIQDSHEARMEENGWEEATNEWRGGQEWEAVETTIEEELDATEELIQ
jgi:translation initiation factor 3 subunit B